MVLIRRRYYNQKYVFLQSGEEKDENASYYIKRELLSAIKDCKAVNLFILTALWLPYRTRRQCLPNLWPVGLFSNARVYFCLEGSFVLPDFHFL